MSTTVWIVIAIIVIALIVLGVGIWFTRRQRTEKVRERFGPEYDRLSEEHGASGARDRLEEVAERRDKLDVRPLSPAAREGYLQRWQAVQTDFVDRPGDAVNDANDLVNDVMRDRGYPVDEGFDSQAELISADHPDVVEQYRAAHDARRRYLDSGDSATTEELRRAMVHYRSLVSMLVEDGDNEPRHRGSESPA
jgi:FtsZ-interacting cell division protein ZipA